MRVVLIFITVYKISTTAEALVCVVLTFPPVGSIWKVIRPDFESWPLLLGLRRIRIRIILTMPFSCHIVVFGGTERCRNSLTDTCPGFQAFSTGLVGLQVHYR